MENDKVVFHAEIKKHWLYQSEKADDKTNGRLFVEGYASTGAVDRTGEVVVPEKAVWEKAIAAFMKNPIMHWLHNYGDPAGRVTEMRIDEGVGFWIKAFVSSTQEKLKTLIQEEIVRAFSVGINPIETKIEDDVRYITEFELYEISFGGVPVNRETLFSISKAFKDGTDLYIPERKLTDEIDKLLTQKIAAMGLGPAQLITPNKEKGIKAPESPAYQHLTRLLKSLRDDESAENIKRIEAL